jgi:hypothetical protein
MAEDGMRQAVVTHLVQRPEPTTTPRRTRCRPGNYRVRQDKVISDVPVAFGDLHQPQRLDDA